MTTTGVILMLFIALIAAYAVARVRYRLGTPATLRTWVVVVAAAVVVMLALYANHVR